MAIKEIKRLNNGLGEYVREFICDLTSDLADMPKATNNVAIGSTVLCLENKTKYILSVGDIWKQFETQKADLVGGKVPASQLPSYVDDVLEFNTLADFPATGESGKIYVAKDTNKTYRWTGSGYVVVGGGGDLALGETSSTAYRGDRGKTAYDHSQLVAGNPHNTTKSMIGLGNVDNTSDLNKPISTTTQNALNLKADLVEGKVPVEQLPDLGLSDKVSKVTTSGIAAYTKNGTTQSTMNIDNTAPTASTLVQRDANGRIKANAGVANNDAVTVEQLNNALGDIDSALDAIMGV